MSDKLILVYIIPLDIQGIVINEVYDLETNKKKYHVYGNDNKNYVCEDIDLKILSEQDLDSIEIKA